LNFEYCSKNQINNKISETISECIDLRVLRVFNSYMKYTSKARLCSTKSMTMKGTPILVAEDLTALNVKPMNRVRKDSRIQSA
jgi:hypothetical protein